MEVLCGMKMTKKKLCESCNNEIKISYWTISLDYNTKEQNIGFGIKMKKRKWRQVSLDLCGNCKTKIHDHLMGLLVGQE